MTGNATEQEMALLGRMRRDDMVRFLTELDEHGWAMAVAVLCELAARRKCPMNNRNQQNAKGGRR